jgi:diacylglycerol kinase family enzyme
VRVLLLVNDAASSVTARKRVVIRKALAADHDVEVALTSRRGHAARLARAAAGEGFDVVVVLAGDGTLNEAADGLAGTSTALAPLPGGSTNVYARTLGLPDDAIEATGALLAALDARSLCRIGVGAVNDRRFLFHCGVGFDAAVIEQVERYGELKRHAPHPMFVAAAFHTWLRKYDRSQPRFDVAVDGEPDVGPAYFAIVSKTSPYTYLGHRPIRVAPEASLDTALALTAFRRIDLVSLLGGAGSALMSGRFLARRRQIAHRSNLTELRITGTRPFPYQVDGDFLGEATDLRFRYEPDALTLVVP